MAKPLFYPAPNFRATRIPRVRLSHWKPVTLYTRYRWLVQALIVAAFVIVPQLRLLKLDFANDRFWLLRHEVSAVLALQAVIVMWLGTYFVNFFENYLVGRLLCGWICPWGLLNRLGMMLNHKLRRHPRRELVFAGANLVFAATATLVVMNWGLDLGTLFDPAHPWFARSWAILGGMLLIGFVILQRLGFKFCEHLCPFGMYLTVVTQKNSLRIAFDANRACVDCGLCTQVCPMDLSPREMDFKDPMDGGFGQCILCGDCIDVCKIRMAPEGLPAPLRWNTEAGIIPLELVAADTAPKAASPAAPISSAASQPASAVAAGPSPSTPATRRRTVAPAGFAEPPSELLARPLAPRPRPQLLLGCAVIPVLLTAALAGLALRVRASAMPVVVVPEGEVLLARAAPDDDSALLGRLGEGRELPVTGRSEDWRWLAVSLPSGEQAWARRPLDVAPWSLEAEPVMGVAVAGEVDAAAESSAPRTGSPAEASDGVGGPPERDMLTFEATTFTMGSPPDRGREDERPAHEVQLSAFALDRREVTVGEYWSCVLAGVCQAPQGDDIPGQQGYLIRPTFDDHPVVNVPWAEAKHYCTWRGDRLPTEAEWERAAGGTVATGGTRIWPWGDTSTGGEANTASAGPGRPLPVGSWPADRSGAGLADMGGNVREWVLDWYKLDYYAVADESDPKGPASRRGEGSGRVVRGASYATDADAARVSARGNADPAYGRPDIGFRCARDG